MEKKQDKKRRTLNAYGTNLTEKAKNGQIDAIIGLPANLFYSTGIPTVVLVLKKNKENKDGKYFHLNL